ncbi:MAG: hypothetical protein VYA30_05165 [Myxococcota bacterium]|nr:hypothetical protein [Myxococcota bacterium]
MIIVLACTLMSLSCTAMQIPTTLQGKRLATDSEWHLTKERDYRFGHWSVTDAARTPKKTAQMIQNPLFKGEFSERVGSQYHFTLKEGGNPKYAVSCSTYSTRTGLKIGAMTISQDSLVLGCTFRAVKTDQPVGSLWCQMDKKGFLGTAQFENTVFNLHSVYTTGGSAFVKPPTPYGYVAYDDIKPAAAIQLTHDRAVWLEPALNEAKKSQLAGTIMALAYFQNVAKK